MKTNVSIELSDAEREHVANLVDGKISKRQVSRLQVTELTHLFWRELLKRDVGDSAPQDLVGDVIEDINRGAWSFIGQPPGTK